MSDASIPLRELWSQAADEPGALDRVRLTGADPKLSETPAFWSRLAAPLGTHEPAWPA